MTSQLETSRGGEPPQDRHEDTSVLQVVGAVAALAAGFALTVWITTIAGQPTASASNPPATTGQASSPTR